METNEGKVFKKEFDKSFDEIDGLKWYPWVGKDYKDTLILGESHYEWNYADEDEATWLGSKEFTRNRTAGPALNENKNEPYFRNFERAYFGVSDVKIEDARKLWLSVAHFNLVQRVMSSINERPNIEDYRKGWEVAFKVAELLKAENIIMLGSETKKVQPFRQFLNAKGIIVLPENEVWSKQTLGSRSYGIAFKLENPSLKRVIFIKHPSSFFKWINCYNFFQEIGLKII